MQSPEAASRRRAVCLWKIQTLAWQNGGLPGWLSEDPACRCRRCRFDFLGWEDPLEEKMETHFSICAWEIPRTEEPGGYSLSGAKSRTRLTNGTKQQMARHTASNVERACTQSIRIEHHGRRAKITDARKAPVNKKFSHLLENGHRYQ